MTEDEEKLSWYCIRTQPRCENIAKVNLERLGNVDVFFPRTTQVKATRHGKKKVVQPLFPNYIFVRFDPGEHTRSITYCQGVSYIISKGREFTIVSDSVIEHLLRFTQEGILQIEEVPLQVGDNTQFVTGLFKGNKCTITELLPARERVKVLLEFMGKPTIVEVSPQDLEANKSENPLAQS